MTTPSQATKDAAERFRVWRKNGGLHSWGFYTDSADVLKRCIQFAIDTETAPLKQEIERLNGELKDIKRSI